MLCWWAYQPTCTTVCSQCSTLLRDPSPVYDAPIRSLASFHWLRVPERIQFKLATIVYRYLATWLQIYVVCLICRPDDVWDRHSLTSSMSASRSVLLLETELSLWLVLDYGTVCYMTSSRVKHCHISVVDSKHFYLTVISFYSVLVLYLVVLAVFT